MARGKKTSEDVKAAVMAALLAGQMPSDVAKEMKVSEATVSRIKAGMGEQLKGVESKKRDTLDDLILDYVSTNLRTLKAQSEQAARAEYIQKQSASELAVLHGVIADKTVRILAAFEPAADA